MLYVDMPTAREIGTLNAVRADACVSIYLETTPLTEKADEARIILKNLMRSGAVRGRWR